MSSRPESLSVKMPPVTEPDFLYHYTDQSGLLGVVHNRELWATKIHYMNDATEFSIIFELITRRLDAEASKFRGLAKGPYLSTADILKKFIDLIRNVHVCVACFCKCGDLLSQWRGYSGANGYGYSIRFNTKKLKEFADKANFFLTQCIYDRTEQDRIVGEICDHYLPKIEAETADPTGLMREFTTKIIKYGAYFKHPAFSEEKEWRLISEPLDINDLHFRPGRSMMIPYCKKIQFHESSLDTPIDHIWVGPCPHMDLSVEAVHTLLLREKIGNRKLLKPFEPGSGEVLPDVRRSEIPYRIW